MKGIVFTELLTTAEQQFGYELVESSLLTTDLPSGGNYTSVGTYPAQEMVSLVSSLSQRIDRPVPRGFGRDLFQTFLRSYRHLIVAAPDAFTFLGSVHGYIHVKVNTLYPDAELPSFSVAYPAANTMQMVNRSSRKMADLAYRLIEGALGYYAEKVTILQQSLGEGGSLVQFTIVKEYL